MASRARESPDPESPELSPSGSQAEGYPPGSRTSDRDKGQGEGADSSLEPYWQDPATTTSGPNTGPWTVYDVGNRPVLVPPEAWSPAQSQENPYIGTYSGPREHSSGSVPGSFIPQSYPQAGPSGGWEPPGSDDLPPPDQGYPPAQRGEGNFDLFCIFCNVYQGTDKCISLGPVPMTTCFEWQNHIMRHFRDNGPPSCAFCVFCEREFNMDAVDRTYAWMQYLLHVYEHIMSGKRTVDLKPDFRTLDYLRRIGELSPQMYSAYCARHGIPNL